MSAFESETAVTADGDDGWTVDLSTNWNIGDNANGGYAMSAVLRALIAVGGHPDPISVTTHFLRPIQGGGRAQVEADLVRRGRTVSVARGSLSQAGKQRLVVTAALGELDAGDFADVSIDQPPPDLAGPDDCVERSGSLQGVDLAIASRVDVRLPPGRTQAGGADDAVTEGWIRFVDGTPPSTLRCSYSSRMRSRRRCSRSSGGSDGCRRSSSPCTFVVVPLPAGSRPDSSATTSPTGG